MHHKLILEARVAIPVGEVPEAAPGVNLLLQLLPLVPELLPLLLHLLLLPRHLPLLLLLQPPHLLRLLSHLSPIDKVQRSSLKRIQLKQ